MEIIGIIDIGSNTIHLAIIKVNDFNDYETLLEAKEHLRLGADIDNSKLISDEKIAKTQKLITKFLGYCNNFNTTKIIAVATEAFRSAKNSQYIVNHIKESLGINIRILSRKEEAFLSFLGATNNFYIENGIVIDLGGNSTEIIYVYDNKFIDYASLPYGAINVTENIETDKNGHYKFCYYDKDFFYDLFYKVPFSNKMKNTTTICIGGTFKNLNQIYQYKNYSEFISNQITLSSDDIYTLCSMLYNMDTEERKTLKGLAIKRHDIILGGCYLANRIIDYFEPSSIVLNNTGIRQGIINYQLGQLEQLGQ